MYATDFDGEVLISDEEALDKFIAKRPAFNANSFSFTFAEEGFPQLNIFVRDERCVIYYMAVDGNYVSKGMGEGVEKFYDNKLGEEVPLSGNCVVNDEMLAAASRAFFKTRVRPNCVEWEVL
ncbi:hypothetical protein [Caballeronia sp. AZ1_KS37]|uniref:hypothetical protein n=1 Tax=Caballeronia sp. AZ1_KS37 TaxID=2921756 RepID=UPI0020284A80|nr:hypothetical protein [Caballeronia sp. AZ1_KS37]